MGANENNGMITKIWGPAGWVFLHSVTFGFPIQPTEDDKEVYLRWFRDTGRVLPCVYCKRSYLNFIQTGDTVLDESVVRSRDALTHWLYRLHNRVNDKLGVTYLITYEEFRDLYESFRAKCTEDKIPDDQQHTKAIGCVVPLDYKAYSYRAAYQKIPPYIPGSIAKAFVTYAMKRGWTPDLTWIERWESASGDPQELKRRYPEEWEERNKRGVDIITRMRKDGIHSIEPSGDYARLPTEAELELVWLLSSNLSRDDLIEAALWAY